jgi:hypothetical protein
VLPSNSPVACDLEFDVQKLSTQSFDDTPLTIEELTGFGGICDNGLGAFARASGSIGIDPTPTPVNTSVAPTDTPTITPTATPVTVAGTVTPGGTLSTGTATSPSDPMQAAVTSPQGGSVSITVAGGQGGPPSSFQSLGMTVTIMAPDNTPTAPLVLMFLIDQSLIPPDQPVSSIAVFRNGTAVPYCTGAAGQAIPDPCVSGRELLANGGARITVLTSSASTWTFGVPLTALDCTAAQAQPGRLRPPNHQLVNVSVIGVTDLDGEPATITITGISQDEPLRGLGSGDMCPDGRGVGTSTAMLRAERSGNGDGRVYQVYFSADGRQGGTCSGTVTVCVPHDAGKSHDCVDQGALVSSTGPCN